MFWMVVRKVVNFVKVDAQHRRYLICACAISFAFLCYCRFLHPIVHDKFFPSDDDDAEVLKMLEPDGKIKIKDRPRRFPYVLASIYEEETVKHKRDKLEKEYQSLVFDLTDNLYELLASIAISNQLLEDASRDELKVLLDVLTSCRANLHRCWSRIQEMRARFPFLRAKDKEIEQRWLAHGKEKKFLFLPGGKLQCLGISDEPFPEGAVFFRKLDNFIDELRKWLDMPAAK